MEETQAFPPEISSSHNQTSVGKYEDEVSAAPKSSVCCCCGKFVATVDIYQIDDANDFILADMKTLGISVHRVT
jgi:hypothetical protein